MGKLIFDSEIEKEWNKIMIFKDNFLADTELYPKTDAEIDAFFTSLCRKFWILKKLAYKKRRENRTIKETDHAMGKSKQ